MTQKIYTAKTPEELLVLYGMSDFDAFKEFFDRTSPMILNYLSSKLGSRTEAEDVLQETYFRIHRYITSYDQERNALAWVMSIARNSMIDYVRGKGLLKGSQDLENLQLVNPGIPPDKLVELGEIASQIYGHLNHEERDLIIDRIFNEYSFDEIGHKQKTTAANARQKFSRLIRKLRSSGL